MSYGIGTLIHYYKDNPPDAAQQALLASLGDTWDLVPRPAPHVVQNYPLTAVMQPKVLPPDVYQSGWFAPCQPTAGVPPDPACVAKLVAIPTEVKLVAPVAPAPSGDQSTNATQQTQANASATQPVGISGLEIIIGVVGLGLTIMMMSRKGKHEN